MKYFIFSDVHGHYTLLINELKKNGFDETNSNHMLISIGDNFDRGKENYEMFLFLKEMKEKNKIILVRGNHEDLFLKLLTRGYPTMADYHNGTFQTLEEFSKRYFKEYYVNVVNDGYDQIYYELKRDKVLDLIYDMVDYYETPNYIFTHGYIPVDINDDNKYQYKEDWRNSTYKEFEEARWKNGMEMSMVHQIGEVGKKIVVGHWHASYGHVRKEYGFKQDINYRELEFNESANHGVFEDERVIAIDACTIISKKINVLVLED